MARHRDLTEMGIVITGASSGIGRAFAIAANAAGATLVLSARRLDRLNDLHATLGNRHHVVVADVSQPDDCRRLIDAAFECLGRLDTLVCNAGYGLFADVADTSVDAGRAIFATNVFGTSDCIAAALPRMVEQPPRDRWRGQVMIVSSAAARRGLPGFGFYSATKAAQLSLAEALRLELRSREVAVTSVHPVGTKTEFFDTARTASDAGATGPLGPEAFTQSADRVAGAMLRAVRRPVPEVWPLKSARFALGFGTLMPGMADRALRRLVRQTPPPEHDDAKT